MVTSVIIDDEEKARHNLADMLRKHCPEIDLVGMAGGVESGLQLIQQQQPQLVFLDIEMVDGSGFELLARFGNITFEVIFVTAYDQYGLHAIKFSAVDYILKPIDRQLLVSAVAKAQTQIELKQENIRLRNLLHNTVQPNPNKRIALPFVDHIDFVEVKDIMHLEADGSYTRFYLGDGSSLLVSGNLKEYDELLFPHGFIRTHQAHLVNPNFIKSLLKSDGGCLKLVDGSNVPISRLRKADVIQVLKN